MKCESCRSYVFDKSLCHRFPQAIEKQPHDFCMEWMEGEDAKRIREDEERVSAARVEQESRADKSREDMEQQAQNESGWPPVKELEPVLDPVIEEPVVEKKRGWQRGRPRKVSV